MDEWRGGGSLDYVPENVLIDIFSYLTTRELVRAGGVCSKWRRLVRDQRLWRVVDMSALKGVTCRILWLLLRQYLGSGLRCLRLRGLLLSVKGSEFITQSWLNALSTKCPRLRKLHLLQADLRGVTTCQFLPGSLEVLELYSCELPCNFFHQTPTSPAVAKAKASSSNDAQHPSGIGIETLVLNKVPSFTDHHLEGLTSWKKLSRLELRDTYRLTPFGLRNCAAKYGANGMEGFSRLKSLEIGMTGGHASPLQTASLGLADGWRGLEELSLGGKEVQQGLPFASSLQDLKRLHLWDCTIGEAQVVWNCRMLFKLRQLTFTDVIFQLEKSHQGSGGEQQQDMVEAAGRERVSDAADRPVDPSDPIPSLRRSLSGPLPSCTLVFTNCSVQIVESK